MSTLQDRLRDYSFEGDTWILQQEAADRIDALEAEANRLSEHATVIRNQRDEALAKLAAQPLRLGCCITGNDWRD